MKNQEKETRSLSYQLRQTKMTRKKKEKRNFGKETRINEKKKRKQNIK